MDTRTRTRNIATGAAILASLSLGIGLSACAEHGPSTVDRDRSTRVDTEALRAEHRDAALRDVDTRRATMAEQDALRGQLRSKALLAEIAPYEYRDQAERRAGQPQPSSEVPSTLDQVERRLRLTQ
ncbi:hypothetical protein [Agromyces binzhouensis]|uniref:hypothetical protein n=1 Tax=Agromyces binzhouensis TaxID=1817495 RepID=UPI00364204AB